jgi:probable phosphoglycerate mutase
MEHVELWMVRHGETTRSVNREIAGWSNPPLTAKGRTEAAAVAERLVGTRFDGVWSSDLDRARESARLAGYEATADQRLRELDFGDFEGRPFEALGDLLHQVRYHFKDFAIAGGETRDGFQQRVESFLDELPAGRHLLFVHGGVIRAVTQGLGVDRFVVTGSVVGVDWSGRAILFVDEPEDSQPVFAPAPPEE